MPLKNPHRQHVFIGEHADGAAALLWIQARKWDTTKDGKGDPEDGMTALMVNPVDAQLDLFVYIAGRGGWKKIQLVEDPS